MQRRRFVQVGYVVPDLSAAIDNWRRTAEIGPFFIMRHVCPENGRYRGAPAELEMTIAFAQAGPMQIELIEPLSPAPSIYRDTYPAGAGGFHHLCYFADDLQQEVEHFRGLGVEPTYLASFGALNFGYFDTRALIGGFTEVLEREQGTLDLFKMIADAAVDWDGSEPIRYVGE